jgi:hypothetical protein
MSGGGAPGTRRTPRRVLLPGALLLALVGAAFAGALANGFLPYDDDRYVTANPVVLRGLSAAGVRWAFASLGTASNWHPLTWLSHMADVSLFGLDARGHHLTSLLCHAGASLLLFLALSAATGRAWRSFLAVALFAVHPLRVESVAWIAERKDVLALLFAAGALAAWVSWLRRPASRLRYALVAGLFLAGLLAKQSVAVLPLLLLLLARWPLGGGRGGGAAPAPGAPAVRGAALLLVPAAVAGVVALLAQRAGGGLLERAAPPAGARVANALLAAVSYLRTIAVPRDLAVFYPFPATLPAAEIAGAAALLAGVTAAAWALRRRQPALLTGWLWYLAALLPVSGLIPIGGQGMADRYTYLPALGITVAAVWVVGDLVERTRALRVAAACAGAAAVLALVLLTRSQVGFWRDGSTLFTRTLEVTRDNWLIEHELGVLLMNGKRYGPAEAHLRRAVLLRPEYVLARFNLGEVLFWQGRAAEAAAEYREAAQLRPDFDEALFRLGRALAFSGRWPEALAAYEETLRVNPGHAGAAEGRRAALAALGR